MQQGGLVIICSGTLCQDQQNMSTLQIPPLRHSGNFVLSNPLVYHIGPWLHYIVVKSTGVSCLAEKAGNFLSKCVGRRLL